MASALHKVVEDPKIASAPPLAKTSGGRGARPLPPPPGINDLRGKREVENKTKIDRLMVGKTNGSFLSEFF